MILYIIKSILCSGVLISVYFLFLQKEKMHQFNRFYLLIAVPLSLVIPLLTIELNDKAPIVQNIPYLEEFVAISPTGDVVSLNEPQPIETDSSYLPTFLLYGYLFLCLLLLFRFFNNLYKIFKTIKLHSIKRINDASLIVVDESIIPHTFLNYIFVSKYDFDNKQILAHELTHARQRHSLDILFVELMQCLLWLNPLIILYKKAIRLNHEFIADEAVINSDAETATYLQLLLTKVSGHNPHSLTSSFSYSLTKKRFIMMTTTKNQTRSILKIIFSVIVVFCITILFSEKVYAQAVDKNQTSIIVHDSSISNDDTLEFDSMVDELKRVVKKKDGKTQTYYVFTGMTDEHKKKMISLYENMSEKQKLNPIRASIADFIYPHPNPKKQSPSPEQMITWTDPTVYGVWLDGKRIANAELTKYKSTDIANVFMSRLMRNAAHYGQYKFHVDLMTNAYFDKTYPPKSN